MALQLKPDSEGYKYVGNLLRKQGRFEEAARQYEAAIGLSPTYYVACNNLAQLLFELGETDKAINWAETALRLNPGFAHAYVSLGTFYTHSGDAAKAVSVYQQGLVATRTFPPLALRLAWLLATTADAKIRHGAESLRLVKLVIEDAKVKDAETLDVLAVAYAETGQFAKAVQAAREALQFVDPSEQGNLAREIQLRLNLFKSSKPYRQKEGLN
jgi:tetratricopeptide (TPR) repeat protein